jgi:hypothetical protein
MQSPVRDDAASMDATKSILGVARKARMLQEQQVEIERQVEQRWLNVGSSTPWVAARLPALMVDSWGQFPFILAKLVDRSGRKKMLVRGKNGVEEAHLLSTLVQEVARSAQEQKLPMPQVELLGSGTMEWSKKRDRRLQISGRKLHAAGDTRLKTKADVGRLTGELAQSSLPNSLKICILNDS